MKHHCKSLLPLVLAFHACLSCSAHAQEEQAAVAAPVEAKSLPSKLGVLACTEANSAAAVETLRQKIRAERLYASWTTDQCLAYFVEACDAVKTELAVREQHGGECQGDPMTAPIVDRFRIYKESGRIDWYDVTNGEFLEFSKIYSVGKR